MKCSPTVGDDFFYAPPSQPGSPAAGPGEPQPPAVPAAEIVPGAPVGGAMPGMPGYSWQVQQQVHAQVLAEAPPAVPLSSATMVAAVAGIGSLVMMVGAWGPWVTMRVFTYSERIRGLHSGINGRYVLALAFVSLLAAGSALTTGQTSKQVRQISAGVIVAIGVIGLGIVIHDWTTLSDRIREANDYLTSFGDSFASTAPPGTTNPLAASGFDGIHVAKSWGLTLSGVGSAVTGLAGAYLFVVR